MNSRTINYILIFILLVSFTASIYNIKIVNKSIDENYKKMGRIGLPILTMASFFVACYFISIVVIDGEETGQDKYSGIYFMIIVGFILTIMNLTILSKTKLKEYVKGKKFSIIGLFMALGVSAIVFGFLDNFGMKLGIEALDDSFLQLFLSPFSRDKRFLKHKKNMRKNLTTINDWVSNDWRKAMNQLLRFAPIINSDSRMKDLSNAIKNFTKLEIPQDILKNRDLTNDYVDNLRDKYDIIDGSKAMMGNTFSDFMGAVLGAGLVNLFIYTTGYDGALTGDNKIDNNFFVRHLNSYMPFMEAGFIALGCLVPVFLNIAMNRRSDKINNIYSWIVVGIIGVIMIVMIYLSANGVKTMNTNDKKNSIKKTLINLKGRVDLDKTKFKNETELENYVDHFIQNIDNIQ
jgi:hypothetical protein